MGEKIADLGVLAVKGLDLVVEINEAASGDGRHDIHLQGTGVRLDLTHPEWVLAGATILVAAQKLRQMKNIPATTIADEPLN